MQVFNQIQFTNRQRFLVVSLKLAFKVFKMTEMKTSVNYFIQILAIIRVFEQPGPR